MEQFRHIGEVVGSLKALMVLRDEIQINQRQCCLILDIFSLAMDTIAEEMRQNLKLEERNGKWKALESPLTELCRVFKEGEHYIKQCLDSKHWLGKAITLSHHRDCVEFHIHNLLCYFPAVIEAIEIAGEITGLDPEEKAKKKVILGRKYDVEWKDPELFQWRFGKQYLVPRGICKNLENAWREDRWRLIEAIKDKTAKEGGSAVFRESEHGLAVMLLKKLLNGSEIGPIALLVGSKDFQVRRRLGHRKDLKEIQWLGQSFAMRNFQGDREAHQTEVSSILSLSHPNILQYLCGFYDEEKKEFSLVMELMNKDLWTYMKENCGPRRQILFSIPVVVDLMLQMARGMEYLHSQNICHGHLNPCNIYLKKMNSQEDYFQAKVAGFALSSVNNASTNDTAIQDFNPLTWYAPEVLSRLEQKNGGASSSKEADAYSFGMICFQLLTGKVPFEDNHLQGDRIRQNIKVGERPLFPYRSPKYLVNLIKKCWQTDPAQRPSFSSICRILRYTKKFLAMNSESQLINPELNFLEVPPVDFFEIETTFLKSSSTERSSCVSAVSQIPYEMFAYKVEEKAKMNPNNSTTKDECCEHHQKDGCRSESDDPSAECDSDNASIVTDSLPQTTHPTSICSDAQFVSSEVPYKKTVRIKNQTHVKAKNEQEKQIMRATKSFRPSLSNRVSRTRKVNTSSFPPSNLSPSRSLLGSQSDGNSKGNRSASPPASPSLPIPSRKKHDGNLSDTKTSVRLKKMDQSTLPRYGSMTDSSRMKKSQMTSNQSLSVGRMRRANTETDLKGLTRTNLLSTPRLSTRSRKGGNVSVSDSGSRMTTGGFSPWALSPQSPHLRTNKATCHLSDYESSFVKKRGSMSPFATCGHVSD
ncbi:probable serine/threonine-protein kinase DDB_G0277165 [Vigna radiata var. radiata]|uniref:Probable serine/threonine-protein kinase DDB_G0277165 n=1 Tax=Vigna radiata var. radiata TaxID=3916 RepID=A0A1S3VM93_VIGRR|nr:probable serine/threonine-protein kinase DDB_G0277165 [Vigna radiata var. radiata]